MKTFALACTAAVAMGLGIGDATSPPETIDVSNVLCQLTQYTGILPHPKQIWLHVAI